MLYINPKINVTLDNEFEMLLNYAYYWENSLYTCMYILVQLAHKVIRQMRFQMLATIISSILFLFLNEINVLFLWTCCYCCC